jgi:hypothetical protein
MPARTLNDFFAGFFYVVIRTDSEAKTMMIFRKGRSKDDVGRIRVEGKGQKEKEIRVCHDIVSPKWKKWN